MVHLIEEFGATSPQPAGPFLGFTLLDVNQFFWLLLDNRALPWARVQIVTGRRK
jgi:hypothetical protein